MYERIRQIRKQLKMSQREFGESLGVSRDVMANIENNRVQPSATFVLLLCSVYNVNIHWLETGIGEQVLVDESNLKKAMDLFKQLNGDFQQYILSQMQGLIETQNKKAVPAVTIPRKDSDVETADELTKLASKDADQPVKSEHHL